MLDQITHQFSHLFLSLGLSLHIDAEGRQVARQFRVQLEFIADVTVDICLTGWVSL